MSSLQDSISPALTNIRQLEAKARAYFEKIFSEHEKIRVQLEAERKELLKWVKQLPNEPQSENNADAAGLRLADEELKGEIEILRIRNFELEMQLDDKQELESEVERLKVSLQTMKDKEEYLEEMNQSLVYMERTKNDELQAARHDLITALLDHPSRALIGIKRMGELDSGPFRAAAKRKYSESEAECKAVELCSMWEEQLKDPHWHPFKITSGKGSCKEIIDEQDEKLKGLQEAYVTKS